jgi:hypothetical protein
MTEARLHRLIPEQVNTFAKLKRGEPYHFERWKKDRYGTACMYYWFIARDGVNKNRKRVPVTEIHTALCQLQNGGHLNRETFKIVCPVSESAGPCGFTVVGRILEALQVAVYAGRGEFKLTNANRAQSLLST